MKQCSDRYADMLPLRPPVSTRHARMDRVARGAQFAPFAALTGFDSVIQETGRLTEGITELTESAWESLNEKLYFLSQHASRNPSVTVTWFVPDERKSGGRYVTATGQFKRVDDYGQKLIFTDGRTIPLGSIHTLQSDLLP